LHLGQRKTFLMPMPVERNAVFMGLPHFGQIGPLSKSSTCHLIALPPTIDLQRRRFLALLAKGYGKCVTLTSHHEHAA